jgi:hypothetical protein
MFLIKYSKKLFKDEIYYFLLHSKYMFNVKKNGIKF